MSADEWILWAACLFTLAFLVGTLVVDWMDFSRAYEHKRRDRELREYERAQHAMRRRVRARWGDDDVA